jgi:hypothetical protein
MEVYEDMICNTATDYVPWYAVPADNKWFTRVVVAAPLSSKRWRQWTCSIPRFLKHSLRSSLRQRKR